MMFTLFTILQILLLVAIYFSKKITGVYWFDIIVSIVFVGISIWLFILYDNSLDNKLNSLGGALYLIAAIGVSLLILLIIAFIQSRWFLTTPIILLFVFWLGTLLFGYYQKTQNITYDNFSEKYPKIQQAVATNNLELFDSEIKLHKTKLKEVEHIVYYSIPADNKHRLEFFDKLIDNGFGYVDAFVLIIENYYQNTTHTNINSQTRLTNINNLLIKKRYLSAIYRITYLLKLDIRYLYIKDFLKQLKIYNQNSSEPLYLYNKYESQELIHNGLKNITLLDNSEKQGYFNILRLMVKNHKYFFDTISFMRFKEDFRDDINQNIWNITEEDIEVLREIFQ